jgi:hypothetical protein
MCWGIGNKQTAGGSLVHQSSLLGKLQARKGLGFKKNVRRTWKYIYIYSRLKICIQMRWVVCY